MSDAPAGTRSPHFTRDATAQTYRAIQLPHIFAPWARVLLETVAPRAGDAVLDVATGPGTVARQAAMLAGPSGRVTGLDISAAMLAVGRSWPAEANAAPIEYVESSASSMPLPDASFDTVYCQQGLQHMSDPLAALREMRRLLKPGGRIGVALWTKSPFGLFRQVVADLGVSGDGPQASSFGRDAAELAATLREAGFNDVQVQTRELTSVLTGGMPQALQVAEGTSAGAAMALLTDEQRRQVREALTHALEAFLRHGAVHLPSASNIASARK
jgi:ubiquinone/menaquinone biosynthesis C-methylase UbiE